MNLATGDFLDAKDGLRNVDGLEDAVDLLVHILSALHITRRRRVYLFSKSISLFTVVNAISLTKCSFSSRISRCWNGVMKLKTH